MSNTRTFLQLRTSVQIRGGYENSADITDTVLGEVVNEAVAELYDMIVEKWADYYTVLSNDLVFIGDTSGTGDSLTVSSGVVTMVDAGATFRAEMVGQRMAIAGASNAANNGTFRITEFVSSTSVKFVNARGVTETSSFTWSIDGSAAIALPADFYKLRKVEIAVGTGEWRKLYPHDLDAAHRRTSTTSGKGYRYRVQAGNLVLTPDPGATTETVRIYYIPFATRLSADTDAVDGFNQYEELIIQLALKRCKAREELPTEDIEREIERLSMRIRQSADGRDAEPFYLDPNGPPVADVDDWEDWH